MATETEAIHRQGLLTSLTNRNFERVCVRASDGVKIRSWFDYAHHERETKY